MPFMRQCGKVL